jgi:adenosylcobinamide-GDP ribazoletransferase
VSGLARAARYLTIVPLRRGDLDGVDELGRAAGWFPLVGLGIGIALAAVDAVTMKLFPSFPASVLVVTAWKVVSGGLHLDGLADCLDGLAGRDPEHRLAVMRDSRIGTFGAVGLILFLSLEIAALAGLRSGARARTLVVAPAIGRAAPALLARWFPAARPDGQGAAFIAGVNRRSASIAVIVAAVIAILALGGLGIIAVVAASVVTLALGRFFARRLGGLTGDVLGAAVEVTELVVLLTVSAWAHGRR